MYKYEITRCWSTRTRLVAELPELPGCMTHGDKRADALRNISGAVRFWIDAAREFGDAIRESTGERLMYA